MHSDVVIDGRSERRESKYPTYYLCLFLEVQDQLCEFYVPESDQSRSICIELMKIIRKETRLFAFLVGNFYTGL